MLHWNWQCMQYNSQRSHHLVHHWLPIWPLFGVRKLHHCHISAKYLIIDIPLSHLCHHHPFYKTPQSTISKLINRIESKQNVFSKGRFDDLVIVSLWVETGDTTGTVGTLSSRVDTGHTPYKDICLSSLVKARISPKNAVFGILIHFWHGLC